MTQDQSDRMRRLIVVLACALNVLSVLSYEYLTDWPLFEARLFETAVNWGVWLAPAMVVILLRKHMVAAAIYLIILFPIGLRSIYIALPRWMTNYEGLHQKGDWAPWVLTLVGTISLLVIAGWLLVQATIFLQHVANRRRKARLQTELKDRFAER